MKKPKVLYVAAQTRGVKELIPMKGNYRDKDEGAVIFFFFDKTLASIYLIKEHNDNWTNLGYFGDIPYVVIKMGREEFLKKDNGGSIYEVPSDNFDCNPNLGMREKEWTSSEPVRPLKETFYTSALNTMIENGVNVYFVNEETFKDIRNSKDHGQGILNSLTPENQKRTMKEDIGSIGIILNKDRALLMHRINNGKEYYTFIGGHKESNETLEETLLREVKEETSISIEPERLLYHFGSEHGFMNYFLCKYVSGTPQLQSNTTESKRMEQGNQLFNPMWVSIEELAPMLIYPLEIKDWFLEDRKNDYINTPKEVFMEKKDRRQIV
jgi:8-oxo-dGTP pyrophosphatase MutT (NUDIX family)